MPRVRFVTAMAFSIVLVGGSGPSSAQTGPEPGTLVELSLMSSDTHLVVGLVGDRALSGEIHEISVAPFRVFVDFVNVVPGVDTVTKVGRGGVRQVRVALNQADPPVTRVVLDLTQRSTYRVEEDPANLEFRIIVGTAASVMAPRLNAPVEPTAPTGFGVASSTVIEEYARWFARLAQSVEHLLSTKPVGVGAEGAAPEMVGQDWQRLEYELEMVTPPVSLQMAHDLLRTAIRLGHVGGAERLDDRTPARDRAAARAGAVLLVIRARGLVEAELATRSGSG